VRKVNHSSGRFNIHCIVFDTSKEKKNVWFTLVRKLSCEDALDALEPCPAETFFPMTWRINLASLFLPFFFFCTFSSSASASRRRAYSSYF